MRNQSTVAHVTEASESPTIQSVFHSMMRDGFAPAMRQLGFKGSSGRFRFTSGDWDARVELQKSVWNTQSEVEFTFNLSIIHSPTVAAGRIGGIWSNRLGMLTHAGFDYWWRLDADTSVQVLSSEIIGGVRDFGLPTIPDVLRDAEPPIARVKPTHW
jgi:hypothetical protein